MTDESEATWPSLLVNKRSALGINEASQTITNEIDFRDAFEVLCDEHHEPYQQKQLANLKKQYRYITAFTKSIDSSNPNLNPPDNLTSLLWAAAFAVITASLEADLKLADFLRVLNNLNRAIPNFGADLSRFPQDPDVQQPLRKVFSQYLACYEDMISHFASAPSPLEFVDTYSSFDTATAIIRDAKEQWDRALVAAVAREDRERLLLSSVPTSSPNGLDGQVLLPHPVNVHFDVIRHLGGGSHGQVQEVRENTTGQVYARKLIDARHDSRLRAYHEARVIAEVAVMHKLRHHHIASCLFWTRELEHFSIVMLPVADYDLKRFLEVNCMQNNYPKNTITHLDNWFGCLISALTYAHNQSVEHKDIKLSNILIKNDQPYLADFGSAADFSELESSTIPDDMFSGTPVYYAPEPRPWGRAADIFALGCVFSEMLTVRYGKGLDDFRRHRQTAQGYAFHSNLPKVRGWLEDLGERDEGEALVLVIEQTLKMLEADTSRRPDAPRVKRRLRNQADTLFCNSC